MAVEDRSMHDSRHFWQKGWFWLGLGLFGGLAGLSSARQPTPPRSDPVEQLRHTLQTPVTDPSKKEELAAREKAVEEKSRGLRTIGELQRALNLTVWQLDSLEPAVAAIDTKARNEIIKRLVDSLRNILDHGTPANQWAAANVIGELSTTIKETESNQSVTRQFAGDLAKLIQTGSPPVQEAAVRALSNVTPDPEMGAATLGKAMKADAVTLRRAAAAGLGNLIQRPIQLIPGRSQSTTRVQATWPEVLQMAAAVIPQAANGLADEDVEVRRLSTDAIGQAAFALYDFLIEPVRAQGMPREAAPRPDGGRKELDPRREQTGPAMQALTKALLDHAPQLAQVLNDRDPGIRLQARRGLENLADARRRLEIHAAPQAGAPAANLLRSDLPLTQTQNELLQLLKITLDNLKAGVRDPSEAVRLATLEVLELMGDAAAPAAPEIVEALGDRSIFVRWVAARCLGRMSKPVEVETAVPALARLLDANDLDLRIIGAATLERYGPSAQAAIPALVRTLGKGDVEYRIQAIRALETIVKEPEPAVPAIAAALQNSNVRVRTAAAETLGVLGPLARGAVPQLRRALADPEPEVRRAASEALLNIAPTVEEK
jgi:HEAT repeat protein